MANLDFLEAAGHLLEVQWTTLLEVRRRPPGRIPDRSGPSMRRFQRIGERDVVVVGEEAHRGFRVALDIVPECFAENLR